MRKEIKMGHGLYKYVEEKMGLMSGDINSYEDVVTATGQSVSEIMQDELEPIIHPTQHDESDDIEKSKLAEGELTEFEKSELKRKIKKRSVWGDAGEAVEWRIVKLEGGGFIRRPFPVKEATLAGPDRPKKPWHFWKDEKWEWKK